MERRLKNCDWWVVIRDWWSVSAVNVWWLMGQPRVSDHEMVKYGWHVLIGSQRPGRCNVLGFWASRLFKCGSCERL